jgi:hypothetical protein
LCAMASPRREAEAGCSERLWRWNVAQQHWSEILQLAGVAARNFAAASVSGISTSQCRVHCLLTRRCICIWSSASCSANCSTAMPCPQTSQCVPVPPLWWGWQALCWPSVVCALLLYMLPCADCSCRQGIKILYSVCTQTAGDVPQSVAHSLMTRSACRAICLSHASCMMR